MNFDPWLQPAWNQLQRLHQQQRLPHAILLCGPKGIGKATLANALAQWVLCTQPFPQGPCGLCRSCFLFQQQSHPDLRYVGHTEEGTSIDDIRDVAHFFTQTSHQAGTKIVSLYGADKLNLNAANALLKTLEEPPGNALLILMVEDLKTTLQTIQSRCFILSLSVPSQEVALNWLQRQHSSISKEDLQWSLAFAKGAPRQAESILHSTDLQVAKNLKKALFFSDIALFIQEDIQQFITLNAQETLYFLYYWTAGLACYGLQPLTERFPNVLAQPWSELLQRTTAQQLLQFLEHITEASKKVLLPGINKSLIFDALFYQWVKISGNKV